MPQSTFYPEFHHFKTLPSTMDEARARALDGAPAGTVITADEQTAGRGRFGNTWVSPVGNSYMTLILRPDVAMAHVAQMSFVVALALADCIAHPQLRLKWPNDVLVDGKKIAGILLETQSGAGNKPDFLLVGMGVNVAASPPTGTNLAALGLDTGLEAFRADLVRSVFAQYEQWLDAGFAPIRQAWLARAHGLGTQITARLFNENITGIFDGIDEHGHLLMRGPDESIRRIHSGDVHFAPNA